MLPRCPHIPVTRGFSQEMGVLSNVHIMIIGDSGGKGFSCFKVSGWGEDIVKLARTSSSEVKMRKGGEVGAPVSATSVLHLPVLSRNFPHRSFLALLAI